MPLKVSTIQEHSYFEHDHAFPLLCYDVMICDPELALQA